MSIGVLLLAAGGLQAASSIQQGRIAKAEGSFAKKMALRNQAALERQATAEMEAAKLESDRIAKRQKIFQARQIARIGKGGAGYGDSTLSALLDTAAGFFLERNLALRRGVVRSQELKERGQLIAAQGRWAKTMGTQAQRLSYIQAGASLLGSAAMAKYYGGTPTTGSASTMTSSSSYYTYPSLTTSQRYSTFSGGGTVLPR